MPRRNTAGIGGTKHIDLKITTMKKAILFIAAAIAIGLTACKKTKQPEPMEQRYHIVLTHTGSPDGKMCGAGFDISGVKFTHVATFGAEGHRYDTTVVAPFPPVIFYKIFDLISRWGEWEMDNDGHMELRIWDQAGKEIEANQGYKEISK